MTVDNRTGIILTLGDVMSNPVIDSSGTKRWCNADGQLHRLDGPAIEYSDGTKSWWVNDLLHRLDGPAIERVDGYKAWWVNGKRHRVDGPAYEGADGTKAWHVNDEYLTEAEFNSRTTTKELSIADIEKLLGYPVKVVK